MSSDAEALYDLMRQSDRFLQVGDVEGFNRIQAEISQLQKTTGTVTGAKDGEKTHGLTTN